MTPADHPPIPQPKVGVLLINLGTPDAPEERAVRRYLAEFLSDPRVVEIPRALWWLILHGVILRVRPAASAASADDHQHGRRRSHQPIGRSSRARRA